MFYYGFAKYKNSIVLYKYVILNDEFVLRGGKKESYLVRPERNGYVFSKIDDEHDITFKVTDYEVKAPVAENDVVGSIEVYRDGVLVDTVNVVAAESVEKANFFDYFRQNAKEWAL